MSEEERISTDRDIVNPRFDLIRPWPEMLSRETLNALRELGEVLEGIRKRMLAESYELVDGAIRKKI